MKICPFCEQDTVWRVRMKTSCEQEFLMCSECDTVWLVDQPVSDQEGTTFDKYMLSLGVVPDWSDIEKLEMIE